MVSRRVTCAVACATAVLPGCRQLFGIDDTEVATDARSPDAPTSFSDAPSDGRRPDGALAIDAGPDGAATQCPASYTLALGSRRYRVESNQVSWDEARDACAADGPNGGATYLAIPDDDAENAQLAQWIGTRTWIGIEDLEIEGIYRTVLGMIPGYTNWENGLPPIIQDSDCVVLNEAGGPNPSEWRSEKCDVNRPFVCECQ